MTAIAYQPHYEAVQRERPRHATTILCGIALLLASVILKAVPWSPFWGTLVIGTFGTIASAVTVWLRYNGNFRLNIHTAFIAGTTLQYLLAPALARLVTLDFTFLYQTSLEHEAAQAFYPQAMLMVCVFLGLYFVCLGMLPQTDAGRRFDGRLISSFTNRSHLVMGILAFQLWTIRSYMLATGSFYHTNRTDFQFTNPAFSAWAQFSAGVSPVLIAYLWAIIFVRRKGYLAAIAYTSFDILFNFISGAREATVMPLIILFVTSIVVYNRVPWKLGSVFALGTMILMGFMGIYRDTISKVITSNSAIDFREVTRAVDQSLTKSEQSGGTLFNLLITITRLDDLQSVARIYQGVPDEVNYLNGETYAMIPSAFVPRQLWPEKPPVVLAINDYFYRHDGGSSPITVMGEGYLNFGWAGVAFAAVISMLANFTCERFLLMFVSNIAALPVYIAGIGIMARTHTQCLAVTLTTVPKLCLLALLIHIFTRPSADQNNVNLLQETT